MKEKKAKKTKQPDGIKVTKEFEFKLTEGECKKMGVGAGALHEEIAKLRIEAKEVIDNWKAKIKARTSSLDDILIALNSGIQKRVVDATMVKDYASREITYYFDGEIVERRTMTKEECQMEMDELAPKRGKKQKIDSTQNLSGMGAKNSDDEIKDTIKEETSKRTKRSAVDGPSVN